MSFLTPTIINRASFFAGIANCRLCHTTRFFSSTTKQLFSCLPVIDDFCQHIMHGSKGYLPLSGYDLVCGQDMLLATGSLFEALTTRVGAAPEKTYVVGKMYSGIYSVAQKLEQLGIYVQPNDIPFSLGGFTNAHYGDANCLWRAYEKTLVSATAFSRKGLIIMDDGGALLSIPSAKALDFFRLPSGKLRVAGIEITSHKNGGSSTIADEAPIPTVTVAGSALKTLESYFIANAAIKESEVYLKNAQHTAIGIVGIGNMGAALYARLRQMGYSKILICDENCSKLQKHKLKDEAVGLEELIIRSQVVFGCTGTNLAKNANLPFFVKPNLGSKTLINLSFGNMQFWGLLRKIQSMIRLGAGNSAAYYLKDIKAKLAHGTEFTLPFGGFPLHFRATQKTGELVESGFIQVTKGALLAGAVQASKIISAGAETKTYMLNPEWQRFLVQSWLHHVPEVRKIISAEQLRIFDNIESIAEHSRGVLFDAASTNFTRGYKIT